MNQKKKNLVKPKKVIAEIVDETMSEPIFNTLDEDIQSIQSNNEKIPTDFEITSQQLTVPDSSATTGSISKEQKNILTSYLNELRKYPVLSREEELNVAKHYYETKDKASGEILVKSNLRFVVKVAADYAKFSNRMIDLIQEGNIGLMQAVKEFNPHKGNRLITYAVWWIRGYIQDFLMRQFSMVRIGTTAHQRKLFYQLQKHKNELEKMTSQENILQLSHQLSIPEDEVAEMVKRISQRDVSLDKPLHDDEDSPTLGSLLFKNQEGTLALDDQLALDEQINLLKKAIEVVRPNLTEKEKIILDERLMNDEPLTLQEIGEKYKISREAVRQNETRLINKIKQELKI